MVKAAKGTHIRIGRNSSVKGKFRDPIYFSVKGTTRFDPVGGLGTLYVGESLAGALLEVRNDRWGAENSLSRTLTERELESLSVTLIDLPEVALLDATGRNLARLGTDSQLFSGVHEIARLWAERIMNHTHPVDGILYRSRHDPALLNVAVFGLPRLRSAQYCDQLIRGKWASWQRQPSHGEGIVYGPSIPLKNHPDLAQALDELHVGILPEPQPTPISMRTGYLVG